MGAEQLIFDPEEAGWLVHAVDGGEVECQPVGKDFAEPVDNVQAIISFDVSREKGEPGDKDGEIPTGAYGAVYSSMSGPGMFSLSSATMMLVVSQLIVLYNH